MKTVLATAANDNFAIPGAVALLSAACKGVECLLVDCGLTDSSRRRVEDAFARRSMGLTIEKPLQDLGQVQTSWQTDPSAYGRLSAPLIAEQMGARRTLYIDADTLTIGTVAPLLDRHLAGKPVGAIRASRIRKPGYFNSGVLLIANALWAAGDVSGAVIDRAGELEQSSYPEQDALNDVLAGQWQELPQIWNWEVPRSVSVRLGRTVVSRHGATNLGENRILHFLGSTKPWDEGYPPTAYKRMWYRLAGQLA